MRNSYIHICVSPNNVRRANCSACSTSVSRCSGVREESYISFRVRVTVLVMVEMMVMV